MSCQRCGSMLFDDDEDAVCLSCAWRVYGAFPRSKPRRTKQRHLTVAEAAEQAGLATSTVALYCQQGKIEGAIKQTLPGQERDVWLIPKGSLRKRGGTQVRRRQLRRKHSATGGTDDR